MQEEITTLAKQVCERIVKDIITGAITQGQKLNEPELARIHGISRGPLREAMSRLEAMRLITRTPNVGARVVKLSYQELLEIYQIRESLEGLAAKLAAQAQQPHFQGQGLVGMGQAPQQSSMGRGSGFAPGQQYAGGMGRGSGAGLLGGMGRGGGQ